jgi:hypothetical protein
MNARVAYKVVVTVRVEIMYLATELHGVISEKTIILISLRY